MYDFERDRATGATQSEQHPKPPLLLTALEAARAAIELPASVVLDRVLPARGVGAGQAVLVIPGFYATDGLTAGLRRHLRREGFSVYGWGLGRNYGLTDSLIDGLLSRLDEIHQRHGVPVSVVGWSFGGLLARWLAHERPDVVRRVVCLGSPWRPEGEITRATSGFERAARKHGLSDRARDMVDLLRRPLPVPCTAIYSKTDGITHWRGCALDESASTENISVASSHIGLVWNPLALAAVADRLAQDPEHPRPFDWHTCVRAAAFGSGSAAGPRVTA